MKTNKIHINTRLDKERQIVFTTASVIFSAEVSTNVNMWTGHQDEILEDLKLKLVRHVNEEMYERRGELHNIIFQLKKEIFKSHHPEVDRIFHPLCALLNEMLP